MKKIGAIDAVVNIWTPQALANRPDRTGFYTSKMRVKREIFEGMSLRDMIARMDAAGIEKAFLIAANVKCVYILAFSITNLVLVSMKDTIGISEAIAATPASLVLIIFCLFILCTVGGLCSYHVGVMMEDTTTRMNLKHIARDAGESTPEPGCGNLWRRL